MNAEQLMDSLNHLEDDLIAEAEEVRPAPSRRNWRRWAGLAACLCLVAAGALAWGTLPRGGTSNDAAGGGSYGAAPSEGMAAGGDSGGSSGSELPVLTVEFAIGGEGMGYEARLYHDISEMSSGNPWNGDMALDTMPVYKNGSCDPAGTPCGLDEAAMLEKLYAAAAALGREVPEVEYVTIGSYINGSETGPDALACVGIRYDDDVWIDVSADGITTVEFGASLASERFDLPDGYNFTDESTDEEAEEVMEYLVERFSALLGFREPQIVLSGDYNFYNEYDRDYHVYDASGDDRSDILNYNLRYASFSSLEGDLWIIRLYDDLAAAEKVGDYPIITAEEARELLLGGEYYTTVPYEITDPEAVVKVELVYRSSRNSEYIIPCYRFHVELEERPGIQDESLNSYGAYYVPAVEPQYLEMTEALFGGGQS